MSRSARHQYLFHLGYDGGRFFGVQPQPGRPTVASVLRARLEAAAGQRARAVYITARTDRGVWAVQNFATCWFVDPFDPDGFEAKLSEPVDDGLLSIKAERVDRHTHARNVGAGKLYRYRIRTDGVADERAWVLDQSLDVASMTELAEAFVGTHDFNAYRYRCQAPNSCKTLSRVEVEVDGHEVLIHVEGDGFLRHMVRKLVSTMVAVGCGEYELHRAVHLLDTGADRGTPKAAPPQGLTLMAIRRAER